MKKINIFIMLLCSCFLVGCSNNNDVIENNNSNSITIETTKKPSELEAREILYSFIQKLSDNNYESNTTGKTTAKKGFISYKQIIESKTVKQNDDYYYESNSSSTLVNLKHIANFSGNNVKYTHNSNEEKESDIETYKKIYGVTPMDVGIGGYLINDETIIECTKDQEEGNIKVSFSIDPEKSSNNMKIQMKEFGSLNSYPIFKSINFTLIIDDNWLPISLTCEAEYEISVALLGEMNCIQNIVTTYKLN